MRAPIERRRSDRLRGAAALALAAVLAGALVACPAATTQQGPSDALRAYADALQQGRVDEAYRMLSDDAKRSMSLEAFRRAVKENPDDVLEIARALARPTTDPVVTATATVPNGDELTLVFEGGKWRIDAAAIDLYGQSTPRQALVGFLRAYERKRYDVVLRYVPDAEIEGTDPDGAAGGPKPRGPDDDAARVAPDGGAPDATKAAADGGAPVVDADAGAPRPRAEPVRLTPEKLRAAWEGPQKDQVARIVQAIKTALPTAQIEETGDSASMSYGAGGTVALVREHGVWKIRDF
jgi:hypothetical protein